MRLEKMVFNKHNTPGIIKFPFWKMTNQWPDATYACLNCNDAYAPEEIISRSIIISGDISDALDRLQSSD